MKIFRANRDEQTRKGVAQCLSELAQLRQELDQKLTDQTWSVDKIVIEKLQTDKVELNLGSINVKELSGMLSIGFNYGGRLIKADSKESEKTLHQPHENQTKQQVAQQESLYPGESGTRSSGAVRQSEELHAMAVTATRTRPHITLNFGNRKSE